MPHVRGALSAEQQTLVVEASLSEAFFRLPDARGYHSLI